MNIGIVGDQTDHVVVIALSDSEDQVGILDGVKSVTPELDSIPAGAVFEIDLGSSVAPRSMAEAHAPRIAARQWLLFLP